MKRIMLVLILMCSLGSFAQTATNDSDKITITVPKSSLTPEQKQSVDQANIKSWVGIGKEVGVALNEGLGAITTQANNFAQTPVGKLTAVLIVFKVMGDAAVHIAVGLGTLLVGVPIWLWSYRKCLPKKIAVEAFDSTTGKLTSRTYKFVEPSTDSDDWRGVHWGIMALGMIVVLTTIFSY